MMDCFADTQSISNVDLETVERLKGAKVTMKFGGNSNVTS